MRAFLQGSHVQFDGTADTFWTCEVETKTHLTSWQKAGLSYTATGYGMRLPTCRMVKFNGKWRRVYARCFSNVATLYIGKLTPTGERIIVNFQD